MNVVELVVVCWSRSIMIIVPPEEAEAGATGGGGAGLETSTTGQQYRFLPVTQVVPIINHKFNSIPSFQLVIQLTISYVRTIQSDFPFSFANIKYSIRIKKNDNNLINELADLFCKLRYKTGLFQTNNNWNYLLQSTLIKMKNKAVKLI